MSIRVLIAPQAFKGTLPVDRVAAAMGNGVARLRRVEIDLCPLADGGDGTIDVLVRNGARAIQDQVDGPLPGMRVVATRAVLPDDVTTAIELAQASGLGLLSDEQRDVMAASTVGTGQQIAAALNDGYRTVLLFVGGSATVDGASGILTALGVRLLDARGRSISPGGGGLATLARIDDSAALPALARAEIRVGVDVTSPLTGPHGAAAVFGPQKGASPSQVQALDGALTRLATLIEQQYHRRVVALVGAGAAGGVPAGLAGVFGAQLASGFDLVAQAIRLEARLRACDVVLTGEGQLDSQSPLGKAPVSVARLAARLGKPCYAVVGRWANRAGGVSPFAGVFPAASGGRLAGEADVAAAAEAAVRAWVGAP